MTEEPEKREQILEAAFHEFATKGFRGATIKSIAKAAGIQAPTLIYWYFPNKAALFEAVIQERFKWLKLTLDPTPVLALPPKIVLTQIAQAYIGTFTNPETAQMAKFFIREIIQENPQAQQVINQVVPQVISFLERYLAHQIELKRLRPHNVRASIQAFMGSLMPQILGKVFVPVLANQAPSDEAYIAHVVEVFLQGLKGSNDERD